MLAFEFGKQIGRQFAQRVDQHVQAAAMCHAEHHFFHANAAGRLDNVVEKGNQGFAAFQRKSFLADVARVQIFFQRLGRRQAFQQELLFFRVKRWLRLDRFKLALYPALFHRRTDVHVFDADVTAIGFFDGSDDVFQFCVFGLAIDAPLPGTDAEFGVEIGLGQSVERQLQFRYRHAFATL